MPRHVAIQPGRLYPQPGYSVSIDKEGKWTAIQVFLCHRNSAVALMPRPGTPHPEIPFITISQVSASITEGDLAEITCNYAGAEEKDEEDEKANAVYTMGLSLSEEPILTHQRYKDLAAKEREALQMILAGKEKDDQGNKLKDKIESERGKEVLAKIERGQTSYYSPRQSLPPFSVIGIEKQAGGEGQDDTYQVIIKEGWVIERKPKSEETPSVKFHMPKSGSGEEGVALDTIPRPKIEMKLGDTLWCKFKTDMMGEVTEDPEVVVTSEDEDGTHYQPVDPEGSGIDGEYFVKLFKLEDDDGSPRVKVYQQSDIEHWAQLWTGENLGSGGRVYKEHKETENIFKFRSVRGDYGIKEAETSDEVELDFWGKNVGEGCPVWVEPVDDEGQPEADPPDGPAKFRSIAGRLSQPQIQVECEAANPGDPLPETIRVVGNSVDGAILLDDDGTTTELARWQDGLVTTPGETTLKVEEFKVCVNGYPEARKFVVVP